MWVEKCTPMYNMNTWMTVFLGPCVCAGCNTVWCCWCCCCCGCDICSGIDNGNLVVNLSKCCCALFVLFARTKSNAKPNFGAPGVKYWWFCCWIFLFLSMASGWMVSTSGGRNVAVGKLAALFLLFSSFFLLCDAANRFHDNALMNSECFLRRFFFGNIG